MKTDLHAALDRPAEEASDSRPTETELLLQFLRGRDRACPQCDYNLRDLTRPNCPECGQSLSLVVSGTRLPYEVLILTLAPGIFSGIAASILLGMMLVFPGAPREIMVADAFGFVSGLAALALFLRRPAFLKLPSNQRWWWCGLTWTIHLLAFILLMANIV